MPPTHLDLESLGAGAAIAIAIISLVLTFGLRLLRQRDQGTTALMGKTKELVSALTDEQGAPQIRFRPPEEHSQRLVQLEHGQHEHSQMLRRIFHALHQLDQGQRDILDYLTTSFPSDRPPAPRAPIPSSIDEAGSGRDSQHGGRDSQHTLRSRRET